jgi:predicted translin family RNA/ssDNA-binding protein
MFSILQLADLTGELMRLAIGRISDGELEFAEKICSFARDIYRELTLVVPHMDDSSDMKTKMETMLQSVMKIENGNVLVFNFLFVILIFLSKIDTPQYLNRGMNRIVL